MTDPVAAIGAVASVPGSASSPSVGSLATLQESAAPPPPTAGDVVHFQSLVQAPAADAGPNVGSRLVDAGVGLSHRYADRLSAARELASISPDEFGIGHGDYLRAVLSVQVSLNEVTVELQSTAQIANSVKDSFNGLYRMQG